jgi:hypothetical protein
MEQKERVLSLIEAQNRADEQRTPITPIYHADEDAIEVKTRTVDTCRFRVNEYLLLLADMQSLPAQEQVIGFRIEKAKEARRLLLGAAHGSIDLYDLFICFFRQYPDVRKDINQAFAMLGPLQEHSRVELPT